MGGGEGVGAPWAQEGDAPRGEGVVSTLQGGMKGPDQHCPLPICGTQQGSTW